MSHKSSHQIRQEFFEFFEEKGHLIVPSAPVIPQNDPTLLFTNAGMNQFKPIFLGEEAGYKKEGEVWKRVADTQRCIRVSGKHNDLEEVGHDTYHHTLFEMLGNWSFGDYFKEEAISWAWELLVDRWGLEPDRLYATVFEGDEDDGLPMDKEAYNLWRDKTGVAEEHILACGKAENFWEMGETGPCGPCSEVHYDMRPDHEREKQPGHELVNADHPKVIEIWNLVFIQFNRQEDSSLEKLPDQHVDTGMGFERICAVLQEKASNYDTDIFEPLLHHIAKLAGMEYGDREEADIAMRVIADHVRAVSLSIVDGVSPGNDGRGYVIRRILRRAIRYGWDRLKLQEPFIYKLVDTLADQLKDVFPVLDKQRDYAINVIRAEEKSFLNTLGQGIELFNQMIEGKDELPGKDAFKLHDTYGFPIDLTELMARERGKSVDTESFNKYMQEQKERARASGKFKAGQGQKQEWTFVHSQVSDKDEGSEFVGYDELETSGRLLGFRKEGKQNAVILENTPFYAESGGQVADTGIITNGEEYLRVQNVQHNGNAIVHYVDKLPENPEGDWQAMVDAERRREIRKHHTATHLMHAALREVLGTHVGQKGSLVDPSHLRFDFSHFEAMTPEEIDTVEKMVNERIQADIPKKEERSVLFEEAKNSGAMMLFGEKYGDRVRIITFDDDYSKELCGGTHVEATGELGYFRLLHETSAAAGIRRVEAVTGEPADSYLRDEKHTIWSIRDVVGQSEDLPRDIRQVIEEKKELEKQVKKLRMQINMARLESFMANPEKLENGIKVVSGEIPNADMNLLKQLGYDARNKASAGTVTVLGSRDPEAGKVYVMASVTDDLISEKQLKAGNLVSELGRMLGGGGGGQPDLATAGGRKPELLEETLKKVSDVIRSNQG